MAANQDRVTVARLLEELIREERRGQRFFADAAKYVSGRAAQVLFEKLALEENRHIDVLQAELNRLTEGGALDPGAERMVQEYDGEPINVFNLDDPSLIAVDLPHLQLFHTGEFEKLLQDCTLARILKLAMKVEYDNFRYLVDLAPRLRARAARRKVLDLAEEERAHFVWLRQHYDRLAPAERDRLQ